MKIFRPWLMLGIIGAISILLAGCARPAPILATVNPILPTLIKTIEPTLARIDVTGQDFTGSGSGFIVDARGYILTNHHVVDKTTQIKVTLFGDESFTAQVVANDANRDLAMLKLSTNRTNFTVAKLGSSSDVIVGQDVLAAGFPVGPELPGPATFHRGIVSALRTLHGIKYIQIDAIINPGNSGGCMVDFSGKVLGITTYGIVPPQMDIEAIGLAIPIDEAKPFIDKALGR